MSACALFRVRDASSKTKKASFRWPKGWGSSCEELDPILTTPGGWGLRNPVPKGPGQRSGHLIAVHKGGGLTEIGRHYDLPNVRVMLRLCIDPVLSD